MALTPALRDHCLQILEDGSLEAKLAPLPGDLDIAGSVSDACDTGDVIDIEAPARAPELAFRNEVGKLPRPGELKRAAARALCLARFAHHELMAVELFAWALLKWPELSPPLQRGFVRVIGEEQLHCRLYLARLAAHGSELAEHELSAYFWRHVPAIRSSPAGPSAFVAAMGLTLEQANLDFTLLYRDAFREAGDEDTARVCQRVHDDEIEHVRHAALWLRELRPEQSDIDRYEACVPFPLAASRAKGRRFDSSARRKAGLDEALIEHVRTARSSSQQAGGPAHKR